MDNLITKPTELSLKILSEYVSAGDVVIDATAGNGHDTRALAKLVGSAGKVYAFDVQETAIMNTKDLLEKEGLFGCCELVLESHHRMQDHIPENEHGNIAAVVFNLGYLPGGKKERTTRKETTLAAVTQALKLIKPGGILAITMYAGHPEGTEEKVELLRFSEELTSKDYHAAYISLINQKNCPPELLLITRKGSWDL